MVGRDLLRLVGHHARGDVHRVARGDSAARCEGAYSPRKAPRVAARDLHVLHIHAELVRDDLRPHGRVRLALARDAGRGHDLA